MQCLLELEFVRQAIIIIQSSFILEINTKDGISKEKAKVHSERTKDN